MPTIPIFLINAGLLKKINTRDSSEYSNTLLSDIKDTGIYGVGQQTDMPAGHTPAVMEVINFSYPNGNYCIQRVTYIEDINTIYQRRIHQEAGTGEWVKYASTASFSSIIPYLYKFATAEQPVFVVSENIGDKVNYRGRGFTRISNEKALFIKSFDTVGEGYPHYYGYGVLSAVESGIAYKDATDQYSHPTDPIPFRTPKGNTVYFQRLSGMFDDNGSYNTVATINGTEYIIKETTFSTTNNTNNEKDIQLFMLAMCDFYLF